VRGALDEAKVTAYLQGIAQEVKRDPKLATLALPNYATSVTLTPDEDGQQLDLAESLPLVQAAAEAAGTERSAQLVVKPVPAAVNAAMLQPLKDQVDTAMRDGLTLTYDGLTHYISGTQIALVLYIQPSAAGGPAPYQIEVNEKDLGRLVWKVAQDVDTPAQDAAYRLVDNVITLVREPRDGRRVDQPKTAESIKQALLAGEPRAALISVPIKPDFAATDLAGSITTPDLLQTDNTSYATSSPERNWNVTYGASKLDGWLIPPGHVFSTSDALGDLTLEAGFKMGWAILVQAGNATTIPSEAGGICQVVTTLFHPVFHAGLPIVERRGHSYWISTYGKPPLGMQGLDATVSPPWTDFRFRNTTGNWLLIRAKGDTKTLKVELWGTNPGWRVEIDQPIITDVVKTDRRPQRQVSDKLPAGREVQVEFAQDGFTSDIYRRVFDRNGKKIDDYHAKSTYLPSHNTFVMGIGPTQ
jgi:vancomycin resistance protein YoaR